MIVVVAVAGAGLAGSVWLIVAGLKPAAADGVPSAFQIRLARVHRQLTQVDRHRLGLIIAAAVAAMVVTRWPVAILGGAVAGWLIPLPGQRAARRRSEARTEAIAQWCEMLRDAAGTPRGIEGMLVATAASAPGPIREPVQRMARSLGHEPLTVALDRLAEDLAHPIGDLVVTALRLAATAGSRRVRSVLDQLATAAHREATMRRRVAVARARPRATMRLVAVIVSVFITGLVLFAGSYLAPYGTPLGQVVLAGIAAYWATGFAWMARLGRLPEVDRFHPTALNNQGARR